MNWKLVNQRGDVIAQYSFKIDGGGNFNESTFTEQAVRGHYEFWFGYDTNYDNKFDVGTPVTKVNFPIPCPLPEDNIVKAEPYSNALSEEKTAIRIVRRSSTGTGG